MVLQHKILYYLIIQFLALLFTLNASLINNSSIIKQLMTFLRHNPNIYVKLSTYIT
jgi:hypothetical protein